MGMTGEGKGDVTVNTILDERSAVQHDAFVVAAGKIVWYSTDASIIDVIDCRVMHGDDLVHLTISPNVFKEVHLGVR